MDWHKISDLLFGNTLSKWIRNGFSWFFILLVKLYQYTISPLLANSCRFTPSCSQYTIEALKHHGPVKGLIISFLRIIRCNPWGGHGYDPVPEKGQWRTEKKV